MERSIGCLSEGGARFGLSHNVSLASALVGGVEDLVKDVVESVDSFARTR